ncbi:MAG: anti-sigma factor family protein [Betaproteobacteria bacterium]
MQDEWTESLSAYLDDELSRRERRAIESHLEECAACARTLEELRQVVARAQRLPARPPARDLWTDVSARLDRLRAGRSPSDTPRRRSWRGARFTFAAWQLASAAVLVAAISGGVAWRLHARWIGAAAARATGGDAPRADAGADMQVRPIDLADTEYDRAVADLQRALDKGRERLDPRTIAIIERNLQIIDQAIAQARRALDEDPANSYLSGYLVETRRRKLDLLRRAAALASETD